jgi:hypothetical protein
MVSVLLSGEIEASGCFGFLHPKKQKINKRGINHFILPKVVLLRTLNPLVFNY